VDAMRLLDFYNLIDKIDQHLKNEAKRDEAMLSRGM
jgi:hypothetical protein